jgi:non-specific serine/threonine protein kinase
MIFAPDVLEAHDVVYNLAEVAEGLFLPSAYIVNRDQEGFLAHIRQRAVKETIGHFKLELDDVRTRLFGLITSLQPKELEKKFSPPRKKEKKLGALLQEPEIQKALLAYVHRKLDEFLSLIVEYRLPLTWNVDKRVLVKDFVVQISDIVLEPDLWFKRTDEGVLYRLKLRKDNEYLDIKKPDVVPITNYPAWLLVDDTLYRLAHVNGNMVKPFRQRDEVSIPKASVKPYFQKFILKVASQLDIEVEGFELISHNELLGCRIELGQGLFMSEPGLTLYMSYPTTEFLWRERKEKRTSLEINEEDIGIVQVRRDMEAEKVLLEKLEATGLQESADRQFFIPEGVERDWFALAQWLIAHRRQLEAAGFSVSPLQWEDKVVYLYPASLDLRAERAIDWFDIHGEVRIGEFQIPFYALVKNIRDGNRFYLLPNGTFFLIPQEWLEKYKSLAQFARKQGNQLQLNRSQFTLLSELGLAEQAADTVLEEVHFVPSPRLKATLRPYQLEGARWLVQLYHNGLGACLADDMGLGKTLQTIAALLFAKEHKPVPEESPAEPGALQLGLFGGPAGDEHFLQPLHALIVLPASLVFNWESELKKFAPTLTIYRHVGQKRHRDPRLLNRFDIILTTYQTALRDEALLQELEYEYIVLDESQQIKNRESKIFHAINHLRGKHKISLSGTPIENSLSDLWAQMQVINPDLLGAFNFFRNEFITPIEKYQDEVKKARLRNLVAPYLLRRTKEEVARDLPPLSTQIFFSEMAPEQKKFYEREKSAARNYLLENFDASNPQYRLLLLRSLTRLRQLCNHPALANEEFLRESGKFTDVLEQWEVIRKSNHKVLFFSSFVKYLDLFRETFEQEGQAYSMLTGAMGAAEREREIRRFEEDPEVRAFLISIKAGGVGLNLTAADYVFILDPWWNPTTEQQAIARAHRIGQDKNVFAVKFITKDSIEEKILQLQERKSKLAEDILGNTRQANFSKGDIEYLLD